MYLLPVVVFVTVVYAILIVVELDLEPGDENPMEHHTGINTISSDSRHRCDPGNRSPCPYSQLQGIVWVIPASLHTCIKECFKAWGETPPEL